MSYGQATVEDLRVLLAELDKGRAILVSGIDYPDDPIADELGRAIPSIHHMGHGNWARFEVDHVGFGFFKGKDRDGNEIHFDGGGAMRSLESTSWCPLNFRGPDVGNQDVFPYDVGKVRDTIEKLIAHLERKN